MLIGTVLAAGDNKDSQKSKRAYSLGYGYEPYYYNHDVINHAPIASAAVVHHAPIAAVHHAPVVAASPYIASPYVAHAPVVSAIHAPVAKVTSSVVSTNVHHYPSSYVASHAPIVASAPYYHAPAVVAPAYAHAPLYTEFHRR